MITYIYDGTFPGLLTAIYQWLKNGQREDNITTESRFEPDLFAEPQTISNHPDMALKLFKALNDQLTQPVLRDLYYCYLSEVAGIEKAIAQFVQNVLQQGSGFAQNFADETARTIRKTSDRVSYEMIRFQGFLRFRKMNDGLYYAPIEPDHNIVELLAPHFSARFADQPWFIHDLRRKKGLYYDTIQCKVVTGVEARPEAISKIGEQNFEPGIFETSEPLYQELWNGYFEGITIKERENKRLQRQHMPKRYWKHMTEKVEG
jgi:probable DNA metabolism protein